jgi:hypothetical protein
VQGKKEPGEETARLSKTKPAGVVGATLLGVHGLFGDEISFPMILSIWRLVSLGLVSCVTYGCVG